jgi:predicted RNA-binding protein with PUA-like domain
MKYWLFKTEPDTFSVDDLQRGRNATSAWDGVRNYQARNMLRDEIARDDLGFIYHSSCKVPGIVGIVRVVREGYPDASAFDRRSDYYDAGSDRDAPRWYSVDVKLERRIEPPITLEELRKHARGALKEMLVLRKGNRLSVTPVSAEEWRFVASLRR